MVFIWNMDYIEIKDFYNFKKKVIRAKSREVFEIEFFLSFLLNYNYYLYLNILANINLATLK